MLFYVGPDSASAASAASNGLEADHIAIYLNLGQVVLDIRTSVGTAALTLRLDPIVADGQWHTIVARRNPTQISLTLDSGVDTKVLNITSSILSLSGRVYVGGVITSEPYVSTNIIAAGQLVGAFDNLSVDGEALQPSSTAFSEAFGLVTIDTPPHFSGIGTLTVGDVNGVNLSTTGFVLTTHFSTSSPEGVILFLGSVNADYLVVTMAAGAVRLYATLGTGVFTVISDSSTLNDGKLHLAQVQLVDHVMALTIDTGVPKVVAIPGEPSGSNLQFDVNAYFVLGGTPTCFNGICLPGRVWAEDC